MLARLFTAAALSAFVCSATPSAQDKPGYTDTPALPNSKWRVHDAERPRPRVVEPAPAAETPTPPPADAIALFDDLGSVYAGPLGAWKSHDGNAAKWKVENGAMVANRTGDIVTRREFGDCQLHVEWMAPEGETATSQGRSNSGVFFFERYEIQILDSYGNETYADGQAAALYGQFPPMVNACRPPGQWQTYDIVFRAPRFDPEGKLVSPAYVTLLHNGILVHDHRALIGATRHRAVAVYEPHSEKGSIRLQDHGNPVCFRNIWVREIEAEAGELDEAAAPATAETDRRE